MREDSPLEKFQFHSRGLLGRTPWHADPFDRAYVEAPVYVHFDEVIVFAASPGSEQQRSEFSSRCRVGDALAELRHRYEVPSGPRRAKSGRNWRGEVGSNAMPLEKAIGILLKDRGACFDGNISQLY